MTVLAIDLMNDYSKWLKNRVVKHKREAWMRSVFLIPSIICFSSGLELWQQLIPVLMLIFWYWLLFDGIYNILRGFKWFFTGSDDKDDAISDNFLQRLKPWQHIAVKIGGAIVCTVGYIIIK
jgi:hypothetical protein